MNDIPDDIDKQPDLPARVTRAARESGLLPARIQPLVEIFQPLANNAVEALANAATVKDGDIEGAKSARGALKKVRCAVENKRKEEKADSLKLGRAIDDVAKIIVNVIEPVEAAMEAIEKAEEIAAQKAKLERSNARRDELAAIGGVVPDALLLMEMNDSAWAAYVAGEKALKAQREEAAAKAASEAKAREEARKAEEARLHAENARLAIAAREALEARQKAEAEARAERAKLEAEAAKERQAREALEAEARASELEAKRKADKERRAAAKAARAPDKEKLLILESELRSFPFPEMSSEEGRAVLAQFTGRFTLTLDTLAKMVSNWL